MMQQHHDIEKLVDDYVAAGDFDAAWAAARERVEAEEPPPPVEEPPPSRWPLHAGLIGLAAAAALALAALPFARGPSPEEAPPAPAAPAVAEPMADDAEEIPPVVGVGRFHPSGTEVPIVEVEIGDPEILEVRQADPMRFAVVGLEPGATEVRLHLEDGTVEATTWEVVETPPAHDEEVWVDLEVGRLARLDGEIEGAGLADPRRLGLAKTDDGVVLLLGRDDGVSDLLVKRPDEEWALISVHVGDGERGLEGLSVLDAGRQVTLEIGEERRVEGIDVVSALPEVVATERDGTDIVLRAVGRGHSTVWVSTEEGGRVVEVEVD